MKSAAPALPPRPTQPLEEDLFPGLFEQAAVGIVSADLEGRIIRVNRRFADIVGRRPEELKGRRFVDIYPAGEQKVHRRCAHELRSGRRESCVMERRMSRPDGTAVWVQLSLSLARGASGEADGFIGIVEDISRLKHQELLMRGLNQTALAMELALTREEVFNALRNGFGATGCSGRVLLACGDGGQLIEACSCCGQEAAASGKGKGGAARTAMSVDRADELVRVMRDGETVFIKEAAGLLERMFPAGEKDSRGKAGSGQGCLLAPIYGDDKPIGVMLVRSADLAEGDAPIVSALAHQLSAALRKTSLLETLELRVKELHRAQEQLLQSQKMEAMGRLAGGVAHDFKNVLTVIGVNTQMIEYRVGEDIQVASHVREVHEALARASCLIEQLLDFSRREASDPRLIDLGGLLKGLRGMLRHLLGEGIDLCICAPDELWPVLADPGQMEQAVVNLAVNARDAMPAGGTLSIDAVNVTLQESPGAGCPPGDYLLLEVRDTGLGMSEEVRSRAFEPFFTTKERGQGTGLGLATVFAVVTRAGGAIEVQSEPRFGTTFRLFLPRGESGRGEDVRASQPRRGSLVLPTGKETILVVEDDEPIRKISTRILSGCGYEVLSACCAAEALSVASRHQGNIHLLLTDLMMPGMSGHQLAERLTAARPGMKVLIITGRPDVASRIIPDARWPEVLAKPFSVETLARRVREALDPPLALTPPC